MNFKRIVSALIVLSFATMIQADTITVMVGDDDGFDGSQGSNRNPGDVYNVAVFTNPLPGTTYTNITDFSTEPPYTGYELIYTFDWDASSLSSIDSAMVTVQSGSVGNRTDGSGFGNAQVWIDIGFGEVAFGNFSDVNTGAAGGNVDSNLEERVRAHTFDITSILTGLSSGTVSMRIDGTGLVDPIDLFAIDFAVLTIEGNAIPEPTSLMGLSVLGLLMIGRKGRRVA